jgi:hypothetical protein
MNTRACSKVCLVNMVAALIHDSIDPDWTKEETDYLFKLVEEFDSRFFIVYDRYEYPDGKARTLEVSLFPNSLQND